MPTRSHTDSGHTDTRDADARDTDADTDARDTDTSHTDTGHGDTNTGDADASHTDPFAHGNARRWSGGLLGDGLGGQQLEPGDRHEPGLHHRYG